MRKMTGRFSISLIIVLLICFAQPSYAFGLFGDGNKGYKPGERVDITAHDRSGEGLTFDHWEANTDRVVFNDPGSSETWFVVPEGVRDIRIDPVYNLSTQSASPIPVLQPGDIITFGVYEQNGNNSNGPEGIVWIVLANDGEKATMISKYGLDAKQYNPYNKQLSSVTWEICTLRKWLNGDFLSTAFSAEEQAKMATVRVTADKYPEYSTDPGNDTLDKVFLLSIDEANRYFASDADRVCMPTKTAVANGADKKSDTGACQWWLRSPGIEPRLAAVVMDDGSAGTLSGSVGLRHIAVRPVVVLRLSWSNP